MNVMEFLGIETIRVAEDEVILHLDVTAKHHQPYGILHGGVSALLAESAASIGGNYLAPDGKICVGLDISTKHLASHQTGLLVIRATPVHVGGRTQVWEIMIRDENNRKISFSTCSLFVIDQAQG